MQQPKLLVVIGSLMVGGTETFLVRYLSSLRRQGWEVEIFTLAYEAGVLARDLEENGVKVTPLLNEQDKQRLTRYPKLLERVQRISLSVFRLANALRKQPSASVLHLFLPEAYVLGMMAAFLGRFRGPKVMSRRSLNYYQRKRPFVGWLEKKIHHYTTVVIGNSSPVIKQLQEEGIESEKLRLIYNGLDVGPRITQYNSQYNSVTNNIRRDLNIPSETLVFIIVANLIPYKGHRDLLTAFHNIKDKISGPWKLLCVGRDQGIAAQLKQLAEQYQIENNILWLGERKDVPELLQAADIGILCSHEEGFSNAVLEAMAAGLPMVVTDVGGNAEAVLQGETGFVVPSKHPEALARALLNLSSDKNKIQMFGTKARERVMKYFTLEKCVEAHLAVYRDLKY